MADIAVDRLIVDIEARTRQFESQLKKLEGKVSQSSGRMSKNFATLNSSIASAGKAFAGAFGATLGVGLLAQLPRLMARSIEELGNMTDAADKAGVSIANLQKLTFAGIGSGTSQSDIVGMMEQFNKRIGEAATKGGELADLFQANGVSLRDNNGQIRTNVDLLAQVADLVKNARTEQEATVIATMALGKSGAELLPFLKQGGDAMRALMHGAQETGFVIRDDLVKAADEFGDKWGARIKTWTQEFMASVAEIGVSIDTVFTDANDRSISQLQVRADQIRENIKKLDTPFNRMFSALPGGLSAQIKELSDIEKRLRELGAGSSAENMSVLAPQQQAQLAELQRQRTDLMQQQQFLGPSTGSEVDQVLADQLASINEQIKRLEERQRLLMGGVDMHVGSQNFRTPASIVPIQGEKQGPKFDPTFVSEIDRAKQSLQQQIAAINARSAALGASEGAIARMNAEQEIMNTLMEHHITLSAKDAAALNTQLQALETAVDAQAAMIEARQSQIEKFKATVDTIFGDMESAIDNFVDTGKFKFKDMVDSMLKDMIKLQVKNVFAQLNANIMAMFTGTGAPSAGGGLLGGVLGSLVGGQKANIIPGLTPAAANVLPVPTSGGGAPVNSPMGAALGSFLGLATGGGGSKAIGGVPYANLINEASAKYGLDPSLLAALIKQESGFNPAARSPAGAMGLAQLMPGTAKDLGVTNPWDPRQSVMGGADYLSQQMKRFGGNTPQALAAYNWGPGNVQKFGMGNMPTETQDYVKNIMASQQRYSAALSNVATKTASVGSEFTSGFGGALQNILGGIGGGGAPAAGGGGLLSILSTLFGGMFAKGGTLGSGKWGIAGENGPEIIHGPARVSPMTGTGYGGRGGDMKVNIITAPGLPVSQKPRYGGKGLDVYVGDFMESKFSAMFDKQAPRYGLRPQLTART